MVDFSREILNPYVLCLVCSLTLCSLMFDVALLLLHHRTMQWPVVGGSESHVLKDDVFAKSSFMYEEASRRRRLSAKAS
jgi:hypothetical protein